MTCTRATGILAAAALLTAPVALAQNESATIVGNNDWLYFRWERIDPVNAAEVKTTTDMLQKVHRVFAENGIPVLFTLTPLKMQVYPEHLPAHFQIAPAMAGNYAQIVERLRTAGIPVVDQLTPFMATARARPEPLLFLRLDSHWTPSGALLAAQNIRDTIQKTPALRSVWESLPPVAFTLTHAPEPVVSKTTDLIPTLPRGTPPPAPEKIATFTVTRSGGGAAGELTGDAAPGITVIGSSFTHRVTQYPNALRHELQRELLDLSIPGRQGPWVGMEGYVGNAAFQLHPPRLIIWEIPERDTPNPPNSPWREAHYRRDNDEWLLQVASLIERRCPPSPVQVTIGEVRLPGGDARRADGGIAPGNSQEDSYVELLFDKPLDRLDYLWADFAMKGSGRVRFEAVGGGGKVRRWSANVPEEGQAIALKSHAPEAIRGYQKIRLYPGEGSAFRLGKPKLCRHSPSLLARP